jgi:hypothetical protein
MVKASKTITKLSKLSRIPNLNIVGLKSLFTVCFNNIGYYAFILFIGLIFLQRVNKTTFFRGNSGLYSATLVLASKIIHHSINMNINFLDNFRKYISSIEF